MKVQAFMPVFNEADLLPWTLRHMRTQGVDVHALDGWSTDGSYEILRDFGEGVTVERFPAEGPSPEQACRKILARIEELAPHSKAGWCGITDADEFRYSAQAGEILADGIGRLNAQGFSAINHQVFSFACVDDTWTPAIDPEQNFRYYDPNDMIAHLPQIKWWKNWGIPIDLQWSGGHAVRFSHVRLAPERWTMKHYPYRTPAQAREKLRTRIERRCHEEHRDGWGVHYDLIPPDFSFRWDRAKLKEWIR